ncbi:MAG TPA: hypothetical protein VES42_20665 [Pilimelia sp.]|nr:hypothetical protein [Pilimelia sp.]
MVAAELGQHIHFFRHAVARSPHEPAWRRTVGDRLAPLRRAFAEHVGATEGPDGLYRELLDQAPRLAHGVDGLVLEHRALLAAIERLHARLRAAEAGPDRLGGSAAEQLRGSAADLLQALARHRQRGADLVYEAYETDIGGET